MKHFIKRILANIWYQCIDFLSFIGYTSTLLVSNHYFFNDSFTTVREISIVSLLYTPFLLNVTLVVFSRWLLSSWMTFLLHSFTLLFYESCSTIWRRNIAAIFTSKPGTDEQTARRPLSAKTEKDCGTITNTEESSFL